MRSIWIAGFALLMAVCALLVTSAAGAEGTPPVKALVWTDYVKYGNGETVNIKYLVTRTAQVTITIIKPDGTPVNFGPMQASANTILTQQVQSSLPAGTRQVTLTAKANDGSTATSQTAYESTGGLAQAIVFNPQDQGQQDQMMGGDLGQQFAGDQGQEQFGDQGEGGQLVEG